LSAALVVALFLAAVAAAEVTPEKKAAARELLDSAEKMVGGAQQAHIHVMAMMDIGAVYAVFDKQKAVSFLQAAFGATSTIPEEDGRFYRTRFQSEIVRRLAEINVSEACNMLRGMAQPGKDNGTGSATRRVVVVLLSEKKPEFDRAMEIVNLVPDNSDYAFDAVEEIQRKLPSNDSRRAIVFGNALTAYRRSSTGTAFPRMLGRVWKEVPRDSAISAVRAVVDAIIERADDPGNTEAGFSANEEGVKRANSKKAKELVELVHVVKELDPKRAKELLVKYPEIADAPPPKEPGDNKPDDKDADNQDFAMPLIPVHGTDNVAEMQKEMQNMAKWNEKGEEAMALFEKKEPAKALEIVEEIPPRFRASLLAMGASKVSKENAALGQTLLEKCATLLSEIKDPADRVLPWAKIAEAAHTLKNDKFTLEALQHALSDAGEVYASDTDATQPNVALPEYWPSIVGTRMVMWSASRALGVEAEPLLAGIPVNDLALLARVELARAMLEQNRHEWSIQWEHSSSK
jgi:hypothetical protein